MHFETTIVDISAGPKSPVPSCKVGGWELLYQMICAPAQGMKVLTERNCAPVTSGLFIAAVLSCAAFISGFGTTTLWYSTSVLLVGSFVCAMWIALVCQIHFWASVFGCTGKVLSLFRASSGIWVPVTLLLPATFIYQAGYTGWALLIVVTAFGWGYLRAVLVIQTVYGIDSVRAFLVLVAPGASATLFGMLFAAAEIALFAQLF